MSSVIIKTKFFIPQSETTYVKRSKIENKLNNSRGKELIIIKAPAGFGKSTIAGRYCQENNGQWISLGENDNQVEIFWYNIFYSLESVYEDLTDFKAEILSSNFSSINDLLFKFINQFYEQLLEKKDNPLIIVLDDFHYINDIKIQNSLLYFINNLHSGVQFVISTRESVDFNISKLRLQNKITEFNLNNLQFTLDETNEFLKNITNKSINKEQVQKIHKKTEGWIASIQLAALSWSSNDYENDLDLELSDKNIFLIDYLIDEVLENQSNEIKDFLIHTSFLPMLNSNLCIQVTGNPDSKNILDSFKKSNLLINRLDKLSNWYRYHHLFRELLFNKFSNEVKNRREFYLNAYNWFKNNNYIEEAYNILKELNELPLIVNFMEEFSLNYMGMGHTAAVMKWLNDLSDDSIATSPELSMIYAFCLTVTSDPNKESDNINFWLNKSRNNAELILEVERKNRLLGYINTIRAYCMHTSYYKGFNTDDIIELSIKGNKLLPQYEKSMIALNHQNLFTAFCYNLEMDKAELEIKNSILKGKLGNFPYISITGDYYLSYYYYITGQVFEAEKEIDKSIKYWLNVLGENNPALGLLYLQKGFILVSMLMLKEAEDYFLMAKRLVIHTGRPIAISLVYWSLFHIYNYYKNQTNALEEFKLFKNIWLGDEEVISFLSDRFNSYKECNPNLDIIPGADLANFPNWKLKIYSLNKYISTNPENAESLLNFWIKKHLNTGLIGRTMELKAIKTLFYYKNNKENKSIEILKEIVEYSKSSGNLIILAKTELIPIFKFLIKEKFNEVLLHRLLEFTAFKKTKNNPYDLTEREIEVIELMSLGKTNKEIGEELYLSPNTIRTHTVNIYDKFGLRSRMEVVKEYQEVY